MRTITILSGISFFAFILFIIYSADTSTPNFFINFTRSIPYGDKLGHFFLFGVLTLLLNLAFNLKRFSLWRFKLFIGTTIVSIFVITEELSQAFFPSRTLSYGDLIADFVGIIIFTLVCYFISAKQRGLKL